MTISVFCAIAWLTLSPSPFGQSHVPSFPGADKCVHAFIFGALAAAIIHDWRKPRDPEAGKKHIYVIAASISISYGISIEFLQNAMNLGRSFDVADIAADIAGAVIAALTYFLLHRCGRG